MNKKILGALSIIILVIIIMLWDAYLNPYQTKDAVSGFENSPAMAIPKNNFLLNKQAATPTFIPEPLLPKTRVFILPFLKDTL